MNSNFYVTYVFKFFSNKTDDQSCARKIITALKLRGVEYIKLDKFNF
jgi:hypothetical protein